MTVELIRCDDEHGWNSRPRVAAVTFHTEPPLSVRQALQAMREVELVLLDAALDPDD